MTTYTYDDTDRPFYEAVYDLLVKHGGAVDDPNMKESFILAYTQREFPATEFRCVGKLGFGGKFWRNAGKFCITYYPEDHTKKQDAIEAKLNGLLAELAAKMKPNPDGPPRW
jgi:hypothetical protein